MSKLLVNLTFLAVNDEIDQFLSDFQDYSSIGLKEIELRMKLMAFILPRCQDRYKWVEKNEQFPFSVDIPPAPLTQRLEIEALILTAIDLFQKQKINDSQYSVNSLDTMNISKLADQLKPESF